MAATRQDVDRWIETARAAGDKYIISVCDSWDYDDFPVYCKNQATLIKELPNYQGRDMLRINEVIEVTSDGANENLSPYQFL